MARRNRYEALCASCHMTVQGGGGYVERGEGGWIVRHDYCADLERSIRRSTIRPDGIADADIAPVDPRQQDPEISRLDNQPRTVVEANLRLRDDGRG